MKYLYALLLFLICLPCLAMDPVNFYEELQGNTVFLTDGIGHGSGVLFTREDEAGNERTLIWTAGHVANIFMNRDDGTFETLEVIQGDLNGVARVLRASDDYLDVDCAVLELVEGEGFNGLANFYRAFNHIEVGQEVIICGTPLSPTNERLVSVGIIAYVDRFFDDPYMVLEPRLLDQVDITAYPGNSGGPVIDKTTGGIVGLLVMGSAPRLTIIEPTRNMYDWSKRHDCMWAFDREVEMPVKTSAWRGDLFDRLINERYTGDIDDRWGDPVSEPVVPEVTIEDCTLINTITRIIGEILDIRFPPILEIPEPDQINPDSGILDPDNPPYQIPVEPDGPFVEIPEGGSYTLEDGTVTVRDADGNIINVIDVPGASVQPPSTTPELVSVTDADDKLLFTWRVLDGVTIIHYMPQGWSYSFETFEVKREGTLSTVMSVFDENNDLRVTVYDPFIITIKREDLLLNVMDDPCADPPALMPLEVPVGGSIVIEEEGTVVIRDADGNTVGEAESIDEISVVSIIEVLDDILEEAFPDPTEPLDTSGYQHFLSN